MKILTVVYSLGIGGTEKAAQNFAIAYRHLGYDSRVLASDSQGARKSILLSNSVSVYSSMSEITSDQEKSWNPDCIHLHSHGLQAELVFALISKFKNSVFVETNVFAVPSPWNDYLAFSFQLNLWARWLYLRRRTGLNSTNAKVEVVPYPVDLAEYQSTETRKQRRKRFRRKLGVGEEAIILGRIGQPFEAKWAVNLIQIFEALCEVYPSLNLVIVGAPPKLKAAASASMQGQRIFVFEPMYDQEMLKDCYASIDIFVHTAERGESFGMVLVEAICSGCPVTAFATPWADNGQIEVLQGDVWSPIAQTRKQFIRKLGELICDPQLRARINAVQYEYIASAYGSHELAGKVVNLIINYEIRNGGKEEVLSLNISPNAIYKKNKLDVSSTLNILFHMPRLLLIFGLLSGFFSSRDFIKVCFRKIRSRF